MKSIQMGKTLSIFACLLLVVVGRDAFAGCDTLPNFADGLTPQRELHVATTGNDDTGDGTPVAPYATIQAAVGMATPGTAVVVHAGVYAGGIWL